MAFAIVSFTDASGLFNKTSNKLINRQHLNNYCLTLNSLCDEQTNILDKTGSIGRAAKNTHMRQCDLQAPISLFIIKS